MSARTAWSACASRLALARYLPNSFCFSTIGRWPSADDRYGWSEHDASRRHNARLRVSPHLARGLDHQAELGDFARDIHGVAADAAGETALRTQRELLQRRMLRRFVDPALELVLGFEFAA